MDQEVIARLEKLAAAGIEIVPSEIASHFLLGRNGFACLVERRPEPSANPFGNIGAPGLITERGLAVLIWRGDQAFFVAKNFEDEASREQVQKLRAFASDLANALA